MVRHGTGVELDDTAPIADVRTGLPGPAIGFGTFATRDEAGKHHEDLRASHNP